MIFIIALAGFITSLLTFFSGFGLGTILMPVFALFFPIEVAIALTGVVHLLNNLFKLLLTGLHADKIILFRFGIPAIMGAVAGAWLLQYLSSITPLYQYTLGVINAEITFVKVIIAVLLIAFSLMDLLPSLQTIQFGAEKIPLGGLLSGFFGGLSGHQGALRSAFLIKAGLSKEAFIATGIMIACLIDISRLGIYFRASAWEMLSDNYMTVIIATLSAFAGALIGNLALKKVTIGFIQRWVAGMMLLLAIALGIGLI